MRTKIVAPVYPAIARAAKIEGNVVLRAEIGPDGRVRDVTILESSDRVFDEAARRAVLQYEYTPGQRNGMAESMTTEITVTFRLR